MSDRCHPHGARACRRCETGEHLDAETLQAWRVIYTHMLAGQHVDPAEGDRILTLIDALNAERAAHATTKAELDKYLAAFSEQFDQREEYEAECKKLWPIEERADVLAAKVARVEALPAKWDATRGFHKMICAEQLRAALAGDGDD